MEKEISKKITKIRRIFNKFKEECKIIDKVRDSNIVSAEFYSPFETELMMDDEYNKACAAAEFSNGEKINREVLPVQVYAIDTGLHIIPIQEAIETDAYVQYKKYPKYSIKKISQLDSYDVDLIDLKYIYSLCKEYESFKTESVGMPSLQKTK